jgi:hypothetical protein
MTRTTNPAGRDAERDRALEVEARRVYRRYQLEAVEGLGFCPWAKRAREEGRVRVEVSVTGPAADVAWAAERVRHIAADPGADIGLLLFPRVEITQGEWNAWVEALRVAAGADAAGVAVAAFHPEPARDLTTPGRAVPFVRRSPDPTVQLVRLGALDEIRASTPHGSVLVDTSTLDDAGWAALAAQLSSEPLHESVARRNLERIQATGVAAVEALFADILADRNASYERVLGG